MSTTTLWCLWALWFLGEETYALAKGHGTLSALVWRIFAVRRPVWGPAQKRVPAPVRARHALLVMALAWLVVHFTTGGWA